MNIPRFEISSMLDQDFDRLFVIFGGVAKYVRDDGDVFLLPQYRKLFIDERSRANVLQANGIQHSRSGFVSAEVVQG